MRRFFVIFSISAFAASLGAVAAPKKTTARKASGGKASSARSASKGRASRSSSDGGYDLGGGAATAASVAVVRGAVSAPAGNGDLTSCMDQICYSAKSPEKARCRCSTNLPRIEKVLRDIEEIQAQADEESKNLEIMMNVANAGEISDTSKSIYDNINSIEKKSKTLSSQKIDPATGVMEGMPLYNYAYQQCESTIAGLSQVEKDQKRKDEDIAIEADCGAYTTILKEKADGATQLLAQTKKNREMFEENEYKKRNGLDIGLCRTEYMNCLKQKCGVNFRQCREEHHQDEYVKECDAVNAGKCEDHKFTIIKEMKPYIKKELRKDELAISCKGGGGRLEESRCVGTEFPPTGWGYDGYPKDKELKGVIQ